MSPGGLVSAASRNRPEAAFPGSASGPAAVNQPAVQGVVKAAGGAGPARLWTLDDPLPPSVGRACTFLQVLLGRQWLDFVLTGLLKVDVGVGNKPWKAHVPPVV